MRVLSQYESNKLNAGPKAKIDVEKIIKNNFNSKIQTLKIKKNLSNKLYHLIFNFKKVMFIMKNRKLNDIVIVQLPLFKNRNIDMKFKKSIGIIHDIEGLREKNETLLKSEIKLYNSFNVIISHNEVMTKFLKENGVTVPIINLDIFDYIVVEENQITNNSKFKEPTVCFAGNLSKSSFLKELDNKKMKFSLNLYGVGEYPKDNSKVKYNGSYNPDVLPSKLCGHLGLVWDGPIESKSIDKYKEYTKFNNPHKLSCYIASNMPVIVWDKSAVASFVKKHNIGYVISDFYDINDLDYSDYNKKLENVKELKKKIINGEHTINAVNKALSIIKNKY